MNLSLFALTEIPRTSRPGDKRLTPKEVVYHLPRVTISLVRDSEFATGLPEVASPQSVAALMQTTCEALDREAFYVLLLNTRNQVIAVHPVSMGSLNSSIVHPRETFKAAIISGAAAIICVHNHPSGDPTPSREDIAITSRLKEVGELIGIPVFDHVVMGIAAHGGSPSFLSFKEKGLM
jgi:DNA repair protein RadC